MKAFLLMLMSFPTLANTLQSSQLACLDASTPDSECFEIPAGTEYTIVSKQPDLYVIELDDEPFVGLQVFVPPDEIRSGL